MGYFELNLKRLSPRRVSHCLWVASRARVNMVRNIFPESAPSVAVLVPPSSSMAAVLKTLHPCHGKVTGLTPKSVTAVNRIRLYKVWQVPVAWISLTRTISF